jgi:hypothetical protein
MLVEMIEMDISFVYFGARTKELCTRYDHTADIMWAWWDPHWALWRHTAT